MDKYVICFALIIILPCNFKFFIQISLLYCSFGENRNDKDAIQNTVASLPPWFLYEIQFYLLVKQIISQVKTSWQNAGVSMQLCFCL